LDKYGSPRGTPARRNKHAYGFRTGDIVRADIPNGKHRGTHTGRVQVRHRPSFLLGKADVYPKYLAVVHRADGYAYSFGKTTVIHAEPGPDLLLPTAKAGGPANPEVSVCRKRGRENWKRVIIKSYK
jgi:hypothetical protein